MTGLKVVGDLRIRWRLRKTAEALGAGVFFGSAAIAVMTLLASAQTKTAVGVGFAVVVTVVAGMVVRLRISATSIARHIDRVLPQVEESCHLVLVDPERLSLLGRMQRARAERGLVAASGGIPLPSGPLVRAARFSAAAMLVLLATLLLPRPFAGGESTPDNASVMFTPLTSAPSDSAAPEVTAAVVTVRPPAYTGLPQNATANWSFEAVEGASVRWELTLDRVADSLLLVFGGGDTVVAAGDGLDFTAVRSATASELYHVAIVQGSNVVVSPFHRLTVVRDAPPAIAVTSPQERTTLDDPANEWIVELVATASDDYGVTAGDMVATVTSGSGESVVFREEVFPLRRAGGSRQALRFRQTLDLRQLRMDVGDELYFYLRATDNRLPEPNRSRTETFFVSIPDTAAVLEVQADGMGVPFPDAVMSQRQIIVDTERLIAQRDSLSRERFQDRSNAVGFNQKQVRLRYGQFLGEEEESGGDRHEGHHHDTEVGATTLEPEVRIRLQGALAEMWDAELQLHLGNPETALPFEYRALELLVEVQALQRREYVKRVGFDPPPLRPDERRLTGDLDEIVDGSVRGRLPDLRDGPVTRGLEVLALLRAGDVPAGAVATMQQANIALAAAAVNSEMDLIPALEQMRRLMASLAAGIRCDSCIDEVERGLWGILPAARARPRGGTDAGGSLGRSYLSRLGAR